MASAELLAGFAAADASGVSGLNVSQKNTIRTQMLLGAATLQATLAAADASGVSGLNVSQKDTVKTQILLGASTLAAAFAAADASGVSGLNVSQKDTIKTQMRLGAADLQATFAAADLSGVSGLNVSQKDTVKTQRLLGASTLAATLAAADVSGVSGLNVSQKNTIKTQMLLEGGSAPMTLMVGLVEWYKAETTGWIGSHAGLNLFPSTAPGLATGKVGLGYDFDTGNQLLVFSDDYLLPPSFELCAWVKVSAALDMTIFGVMEQFANLAGWELLYGGVNGITPSFILHLASEMPVISDTYTESSVLIVLGTWYFVQAWHDGVTAVSHIRVNGVEDSAPAPEHQNTGGAFIIGNNGTGNFPFDGVVDEIAIWSRNLTPAERAYLYNAGAGRTYPP